MNYLEVNFTTRQELLTIAEKFPRTWASIRRATLWLAVRRAIIIHARMVLGVRPDQTIMAMVGELRASGQEGVAGPRIGLLSIAMDKSSDPLGDEQDEHADTDDAFPLRYSPSRYSPSRYSPSRHSPSRHSPSRHRPVRRGASPDHNATSGHSSQLEAMREQLAAVEVARRRDQDLMDAKLSQMAEMVSALASQTSSRLDLLLTIPQRRSLERSRPRSGQRAGCETEDRLQDGGRVAERNRPRRRRGKTVSLSPVRPRSPVRARSPVRVATPTVLVAPSQHHTMPPAELVAAPQPSVLGPPDTPPASATQRRRGFEYQADGVVQSLVQSPLTPGGLRA